MSITNAQKKLCTFKSISKQTVHTISIRNFYYLENNYAKFSEKEGLIIM